MSRIILPKNQREILDNIISNAQEEEIISDNIYLIQKKSNHKIILTNATTLPTDIINIIYSYTHDIIDLDIQHKIIYHIPNKYIELYLNIKQKNICDLIIYVEINNNNVICETYTRNMKHNIIYEHIIDITDIHNTKIYNMTNKLKREIEQNINQGITPNNYDGKYINILFTTVGLQFKLKI